ncbi:MAG TPA: response regulator transcription factor [Candidatus Dormibacteraeota bacterium]|jgi:DNA-binding response OmpR family regulator|nr:response regulator transcription factor [Candidatus Dormibacteraeota bacterium]
MSSVLVVEDEVDLSQVMRDRLVADGHEVVVVHNGAAAMSEVSKRVPDVVLLDWMLPDMDGLAVCRRLRQQHLMPIIMVTARGDEVDRVLGLEVGADDYLVKPFSLNELLARVRAMLRRVDLDVRRQSPAAEEKVQAGPLVVDTGSRMATLEGKALQLTRKEFELLAVLVANPGRAFSREFLVERIWGSDFDGFDRAVDTHVTRLRRKLGKLGDRIVTVWGVGYRFNSEA